MQVVEIVCGPSPRSLVNQRSIGVLNGVVDFHGLIQQIAEGVNADVEVIAFNHRGVVDPHRGMEGQGRFTARWEDAYGLAGAGRKRVAASVHDIGVEGVSSCAEVGDRDVQHSAVPGASPLVLSRIVDGIVGAIHCVRQVPCKYHAG